MKLYKIVCLIFGIHVQALCASISLSYAPHVQAIIFDCDGVLVDTEYLKFLAWRKALSNQQIDFTLEDYLPLIGHSSQNILKMIQTLKNRALPNEIIEIKNGEYQRLQKQGVPPIQEMVAFAQHLSKAKKIVGITLGLASSAPKKEIMHNLHQIGLEHAFDVILSGSDDLDDYVDAEGTNKPKPYIYIEAAKRLHVRPSQCIVFEDTAAGVEAAAKAGMIAIAVPNTFTTQQDFLKATFCIRSYKDLPKIDF